MANRSYETHIFNLLIRANQPICKAIFETSIMQVRGQCFVVISMLVTELDWHFVDSKLVNAFDIVYPQLWMQLDVDFSFSLHMFIIKKHYFQAKRVKPSLLQVVKPLDVNILDLQMCIFEFTMKTQAPKAMVEPFDTNPMTKFWVKISNNVLLIQQLNEYLKLVAIMVVLLLGSIKDEQTFSTFTFMKDKLRNRLGLHFDTTICMFEQK